MDTALTQKVFPAYFQNFEMPATAEEQVINVYRACPTRAIDHGSFLNTYEENGFNVPADKEANDPQVYCLSTCIRPKDIRRFVIIDSRFQPPWLMAKGCTSTTCGIACETKSWKPQVKRGSHVDWWLYENAEPWRFFEECNYEFEAEHFPDGWT